MNNIDDIERTLGAELDLRAKDFDQAPDYEELSRRMAEPPLLVALADTRPEPRRRRTAVLVATAAALALMAGIGVSAGLNRGAETEAAAPTAIAEEELYYWPTQLPAGWGIIETEVVVNDSPMRGIGVLGATAADGRLVMVSVEVSDGADEGSQREPVAVRVIDGVEIGVDYVDEYDAFLKWQVDGYQFSLLARRVDLDEAFRLAGAATADHDQATGAIQDLWVPFAEDFDVLVDQQPYDEDPRGGVVFRLSCPETGLGEGCAHTISIRPPMYDSADLSAADWRVHRSSTMHRSPAGQVELGFETLGGLRFNHARADLPNGLEFVIYPDLGPLGQDLHWAGAAMGSGHSPLTLDEVETILAGLDQVDAATYDRLAQATR